LLFHLTHQSGIGITILFFEKFRVAVHGFGIIGAQRQRLPKGKIRFASHAFLFTGATGASPDFQVKAGGSVELRAGDAKFRLDFASQKQSAAAASSAPPKTPKGTVMPWVRLFNSPTMVGPR
jgi:hypothetical protein